MQFDTTSHNDDWLKPLFNGDPARSTSTAAPAAMRGILWYSVGARASQRIPTDIKFVLHCCGQARSALKQSIELADKIAPNHDSAALDRWMLAQTDALHAGCLAENDQRADALKELSAVCDEEQRLLPRLQQEQNAIIAAWKAIDPGAANQFAEAVPGADPRLLKFYYADNLRRLAEATADQGADATAQFERLEAALAALDPSEASALWYFAPQPRPNKKIWQAAREALSGLDSPPHDSGDKVLAMQIRDATDLLARSAVALTETLGKEQPIPKDEIKQICDPALEALRRLPELAGPLTPDEKDLLQRLDQIRAANL